MLIPLFVFYSTTIGSVQKNDLGEKCKVTETIRHNVEK